jgi:alpha-galactosidase
VGDSCRTPRRPSVPGWPQPSFGIADAEGWIARPTSLPSQIAEDLGGIRATLRERGRDPTTLTVAHENFLHLVTTEDPAEAERVQRRAFAAVMGDGRPFEYFQQVYLTGTLSEVLAKIDERIRVGVEYLMLHTLEPSPRQLDLWAEHVLPRLMDRGAPVTRDPTCLDRGSMSSKIVLNGAGSAEFTKELLADILGFEELADVTIALHDVNAERLQTAEAIARWTADALGAPARIESHLDRRAALDGADHVISMIRVGGHEGLALDFRVPARHGIRQAMADTLGIGSIFRALCTIPSLLALGKDISELCPQAWLYNYTNPMAALVWSIYEGTAHRRVVGVCMSAQNTAEQLAELVGVPFDEVSWLTAGMNHQAWLLRFEHEGRDLYPLLDEAIARDPEGLGRRVRVEIYRRSACSPESSEHNADLVPWFLPHEDRSNGSGSRSTNTSIGASATSARTRRFAASSRPGSRSASSAGPSTRRRSSTDRDRDPADRVRQRPQRGLHQEPARGGLRRGPCLVDRAGVQPTSVGSPRPGRQR